MRNFVLILMIAALMVSCATKKFVVSEVERSEIRTQSKIEEVKEMIEATQTEVRDLAKEFDVKLDPIEKATKENALVIEKMGELRFQTTLSDSKALFEFDSANLTDEAKAELDKFGNMVIAQKKIVHVEIQGHTDNIGKEEYNMELGESRAMSVRNYLYDKYDIPLHLMSVISFGSSKPVADNATKDGRAQNRRVVIVVRVKL